MRAFGFADNCTQKTTQTALLAVDNKIWRHFACGSFRRALLLIARGRIAGSGQDDRTISSTELNALLRLHLCPINVVVYHGPQGEFILG